MEAGILRVKKGDIFYTIWGNKNSNYNFIVVDHVSNSGKNVFCRMLKTNVEVRTDMFNMVEPGEPVGDKFRIQVMPKSHYDKNLSLRGSFPFLSGKKQYGLRSGLFFMHNAGDMYKQPIMD